MKKTILSATFCLILTGIFAQSWEIVGNVNYGHGYYDIQELEMINDVPHVIYEDYNTGDLTMSVYENNTWSVPTNGIISTHAGGHYRSVADTNGIIYVAYYDGDATGDVSVKKWNGTNWEFVGAEGFGVGAVVGYTMQIRCLSDNSIIVAYPAQHSVSTGFGDLDIFRFNGVSWEYIGQNVAGEEVGYLSMAVLSTDEIYINYRTIGYDSRTVKYDGVNWNVLTTPFDSDTIYRSFIAAGANDEILAWRVNYNESAYEFFRVNNDVWEPITSPNHVTSSDPLDYNWAIEYNKIDSSWYAGFTAHPVTANYMKKFDGNDWGFIEGIIEYNIGGFRYSDLEFDSQGVPFYTSGTAYNLMTWNPTPVGIENISEKTEFTLYPNPSSSSIAISFNAPEAQFSIFDMNGKKLLSKYITNQESIDLSAFEKGMYIVKMNGKTQRLIIE